MCEAAEVAFHLPAAHAVLGLWRVLSGRLDRTGHHARRGWELARRRASRVGGGRASRPRSGRRPEGNHGPAQDWRSRAQAFSEYLVWREPRPPYLEENGPYPLATDPGDLKLSLSKTGFVCSVDRSFASFANWTPKFQLLI